MMNYHYSIVIEWSDEDQCFVASLPEWGELCHTHGDTYEEAVKNAQEVINLLIESALEDGESLPEPQSAHYPFQKKHRQKNQPISKVGKQQLQVA